MTGRLDIEDIDLEQAALFLKRAFVGQAIEGAVVGRTQLRDALVAHLECSELDGELVVDTMVGRGFLKLEHVSDGRELWRVIDRTG